VRRDFHVEDADGFVFEGEVMMRLGGDFDLRGDGLRGQQGSEEAEQREAFHAGDCSIGERESRGWSAKKTGYSDR
jgi:hypothetical protein